MIARWSTAAKLGAAFGVHRAMDAVGALTGPLIASALLFAWPERFDLVFAVSLGFACAGLLVLGRRVPRPPPPALDAAAAGDPDTAERTATDAGAAAAWSSLRDSLRRLARAPTAALCAGSALLALFTVSDGLVYAGLQARGVLSAASMPLMFVATAAVFMALAWPLGRLADRHGPLRVFAAGHVALVALYALLASGGSWPWTVPQAGLVVLTVALMGVYYAATDGVVMALAARGLPADLQTTGMALVASAIGLARLGSSVLFGWCWTTWSQDVALSVFAAGLGAALAVALLAMKRWTAHRSGTAEWAT